MTSTFNHRPDKPVDNPQRREYKGQKLHFATDAEMADPEWVSKFTLNNPGVKLVQNKPVKVRRDAQ